MVNFSTKLFKPQGKYRHASSPAALLQHYTEYLE